MNKIFKIVHTKSKDRVKTLGEVFTQSRVANEMLDLLQKDRPELFSENENLFFEPCCGTGNILLEIVKRRIEKVYSIYKSEGRDNPEKWAIAFTASTTYGCDIDLENVNECRTRLRDFYTSWFTDKTNIPFFVYGSKHWRPVFDLVEENIEHADALSGLETDYDKAYESAKRVKTSHEYFKKYGHKVLKVIRDVTN